MEKVSREVATEEIEKWLDYKKINAKKRDTYAEYIDQLIDAVVEGVLVLKEDFTLVQTLNFPTDGEIPVTALEFKPRIKVGTLQLHMQGVKTGDTDGRVLANIAAVTSKPKDVIKAIDSVDYSLCQAIIIFFL